MGERIRSQKAGRGLGPHKVRSHSFKADTKYVSYDNEQRIGAKRGMVVDLVHDRSRTAPFAKIIFDNKETCEINAVEGLAIGAEVKFGKDADIVIGNVLPVTNIPEGTPICNVEKVPGDGGTLIKSSGLYGLIVTKDDKNVYIRLPSRKTISISHDSRATIGCIAGGSRSEKPLVKAGNAYKRAKAKSKKYPRVRGVAMNPVSHPFGGGAHHAGKSKSTSRNAPPGRKVGAIASKRTGRRKR